MARPLQRVGRLPDPWRIDLELSHGEDNVATRDCEYMENLSETRESNVLMNNHKLFLPLNDS